MHHVAVGAGVIGLTAAIGPAEFAANVGRLAVLAVPVLLGVTVVRLGAIGNVSSAVDALNVYTLHIGFPALLVIGVLDVDGSVASQWGFWVVVPAIDMVLLAISWLVGRSMDGRQGGTIALVLLFGNTAYLGLPFVVSVFGERARGPASLLVAVQVGLAVLVGPVVLHHWSGGIGGGLQWRRLLAQPLLWAPLAGLVARTLPDGPEGAVADTLSPLAASTAPVAMFLVGIYLVDTWQHLRSARTGVWVHVWLRLVIAPLVSAGVAVVLREVGALSSSSVAIVIVLGGMPAAISTFSLAYNEGVEADRIASVVVRSSLVAAFTMPILATLAETLTPR